MSVSARQVLPAYSACYRQFAEHPIEFALASTGETTDLGVKLTDQGLEVGVFASHANRVDFCLLWRDEQGEVAEKRYSLHYHRYGIWRGFIPDVQLGQAYGFRAWGPWNPSQALFYNPAKLLADPYAKGYKGNFQLESPVFAHLVDQNLNPLTCGLYKQIFDPTNDEMRATVSHCTIGSAGGTDEQPIFIASPLDSAAYVPWSVVVDDDFPPLHPAPKYNDDEIIIYETHVVGLTKNLPGLPAQLRGTYAGLAHPVTLEYLRSLGVTTLELLPVHYSLHEPFLQQRGLSNYWGYNTLGYFAPNPHYATASAQAAGAGAVLNEFKGMVSILHQAGFEVILDVVYNHTCEGTAQGPTLSWRGLDNSGYYLHQLDKPGVSMDTTGCGNSLNFNRQAVVQLTLDSLRYWATEMGVDGFRFDLATTLGRQGPRFLPNHPLFSALGTDPILRTKRLIAEPWDIGPDGWKTGHFPAPLGEWNDRFRDAARRFWLSDVASLVSGGSGGDMRDLATRLSGSADLFAHGYIPGGRSPLASVNYVTAHDGFTLRDLTCYNYKHNEANREDNRDGSDGNWSWNHGWEGQFNAYDFDEVSACHLNPAQCGELELFRHQSALNLLGTLFFSAGTPMLVAGDEFGRTQRGNNNAYCQDNEISWLDWKLLDKEFAFFDRVRQLIHLRKNHPVLRPTDFASGTCESADQLPDLTWFTTDGSPMSDFQWHDAVTRCLQMRRNGRVLGDQDALLVINGGQVDLTVQLAPALSGFRWQKVWESQMLTRPENFKVAGSVSDSQTDQSANIARFSLQIYLSVEV